jgi:hypothetical protein
MDAEYAAYQESLKGLKTATDTVNTCKLALHAAVDKKAEEFGAQVASDTSVKAAPQDETGLSSACFKFAGNSRASVFIIIMLAFSVTRRSFRRFVNQLSVFGNGFKCWPNKSFTQNANNDLRTSSIIFGGFVFNGPRNIFRQASVWTCIAMYHRV